MRARRQGTEGDRQARVHTNGLQWHTLLMSTMETKKANKRSFSACYSSFLSPAAAATAAVAAVGPAGLGAVCRVRLSLPALGPMNSFSAPSRI